MQHRTLGQQGLKVSSLSLGCMAMSFAYGPAADEAECLHIFRRALELGINFWDTAEDYGPYTNEELIGRALKEVKRDDVIIATKFGFKYSPTNDNIGLDSNPEHIRKSIESSLKRLGTDHIDLYYQHRLDPNTPIEDTMTVLADLVKQGKVKYIGLSEVSPTTIRKAHAIHPLSAIQSEYSLWVRDVEDKILPTIRELGIGFVPYSPLGRGFLTGKIASTNSLDQSDFRRTIPLLHGENLDHNFELVKVLKEIATANHATPAQIALAWLLHQGNDIVSIPGTRHLHYLEENAAAAALTLPPSAWTILDQALTSFRALGPRYAEENMSVIDK